jgi:hypothetical protein
MRRVALAVLLLTSPLVGCTDGAEGPTIEAPAVPTGLRLTYDSTINGTESTDTFMTYSVDEGTRLLAWDVSRDTLRTPFTDYDSDFDLRKFNWTDTFQYPLEPGKSYDTRVGGAKATITWQAVDAQTPVRDADRALEGTAVTENDNTVATFRIVPGDPAVLSYVDVETPDGTDQTWELTDLEPSTNWNDVPTWEKGDWWSYNGTFTQFSGEAQMLYLTDRKKSRGSLQYSLTATDIEDQDLSRPLLHWRQSDLAPQSGYISSIGDKFWSWPLLDEKTWTGSASGRDSAAAYQAKVDLEDRIRLPDGSLSFGFEIETRTQERETLSQYTYSPRVEHLTEYTGRLLDEDEPSVNFELEGWGHDYVGPVDVPIRETLISSPVREGPFDDQVNLTVPEPANTVSVNGRAVSSEPDPGNATFRLIDSNGTGRYERNASGFSDRQLQLNGLVPAQPGNWTFEARGEENISYTVQIRANWYETRQMDFS